MRERGERPRRSSAPGDGGPRLARTVLGAEPGTQHGDIQIGHVRAVITGSEGQQGGDVTEVRPDGVRRQAALEGKVPAEGGQG
jgi:hypothetical protein